jgi:hypothetical protein
MGLGSADDVSLAEARDKADDARKMVLSGQNPIETKRLAALVNAAKPTLGQIADELIEAKKSEWRNAKHPGQWKVSLEQLALPLRSRPVDEIDTPAILEILKPLLGGEARNRLQASRQDRSGVRRGEGEKPSDG